MTDVLPILGERSLQTATTADLGPAALGGAIASSADSLPDEPDPELSRLKTELRMVEAVQAAVRIYEQPPGQSIRVQSERVDLHLTPADWPRRSLPRNTAHPATRLTRRSARGSPRPSSTEPSTTALAAECRRRSFAKLATHPDLNRTRYRTWPMINTTDLVGDLGTNPAYLLRCAPWLTTEQIRLLQQPGPDTWTTARLPLLGAAHHRLGDADRARRAQRRRAERTSELKRRQQVIDDNIIRRRP